MGQKKVTPSSTENSKKEVFGSFALLKIFLQNQNKTKNNVDEYFIWGKEAFRYTHTQKTREIFTHKLHFVFDASAPSQDTRKKDCCVRTCRDKPATLIALPTLHFGIIDDVTRKRNRGKRNIILQNHLIWKLAHR